MESLQLEFEMAAEDKASLLPFAAEVEAKYASMLQLKKEYSKFQLYAESMLKKTDALLDLVSYCFIFMTKIRLSVCRRRGRL